MLVRQNLRAGRPVGIEQSHDWALEWFKAETMRLLRLTVRDFRDALVENAWGDPNPQPIDEDTYAFRAALLLRSTGRSWLKIENVAPGEPQYLHIGAMDEVIGILDASPYLGVDFLAEVLPDPSERTHGGSTA